MVDKKNLIKEFQSVVKKPIMIEGIEQYLSDWRGVFEGRVKFVVFPSTTEEVSKILKLANKNNIKLIEVAFEKSNLSEEQSKSDAIIHGFNSGTLEVIKKIIDSLK